MHTAAPGRYLNLDYEPYFADGETEARRLSGFYKATQGFRITPEIKTWASLSPGLRRGSHLSINKDLITTSNTYTHTHTHPRKSISPVQGKVTGEVWCWPVSPEQAHPSSTVSGQPLTQMRTGSAMSALCKETAFLPTAVSCKCHQSLLPSFL